MKRIILSFNFTICFLFLKASPQAPDYLIVGKDTLPVYQLILEEYLQSLEHPNDSNSLFGFRFRSDTTGLFAYIAEEMATNCWRGYQAVYSWENYTFFILCAKQKWFSQKNR
ncbi:MAG: hypothetical protein LBC68_00530 [Prevotellaceae bacterium]|jgi:hypothetical protein|nr:hypothetical protein [Prevotellaceae bacterium]